MKLWKRTMAMALAVGFAFSAAACGDEGLESVVGGLTSSSGTSVDTSVGTSEGTSESTGGGSSESTGGGSSESTGGGSSESTGGGSSESTGGSSESTGGGSSESTGGGSSESTGGGSSESTGGGSSESTGGGSSESTGGGSSESTGGGDSSGSGSAPVETVADKFMNAIEASINAAKSFKVIYEFTVDSESTQTALDSSVEDNRMYDSFVHAKMPVTVSVTDNGVNLKAEVIEVREEDNAEIKRAEAYVIDGYVYVRYNSYDYETQTSSMSDYFKVQKSFTEAMALVETMVPTEMMEIANGILTKLSEANLNLPTWEDIKGEVAKTFTVDGNMMKLGFEAPAAIEAALDEIIAYDINRTWEAAINEALLEIVPAADGEEQLTMDAILDYIAPLGAVTVEEMWLDLDGWLETEYQTSIQEVYNTVVNDDTFEQIVVLVSGSPDQPALLQSMTDLYNTMFGEDGEYKDMTVDYLVDMFFQMNSGSLNGTSDSSLSVKGSVEDSSSEASLSEDSSSEEAREPITVEYLVGYLRNFWSTELLSANNTVNAIKAAAQQIKGTYTFNKLGMEIGAEFEGEGESLKLKEAYYTFVYDVEQYDPNYQGAYRYEGYEKQSVQMRICELSDQTVAIALPAGVETVEVWFCENGCGDVCIVEDCTREDMENALLCGSCYAIAKAETITLNETVENVALAANGAVAYEFTVTEEGSYEFRVVGGGNCEFSDMDISIVSIGGVEVTNGWSGCSSDDTWYVYTESYLKAGTYYAVFESEADTAFTIEVTVSHENTSEMSACARCGGSTLGMPTVEMDGHTFCTACYEEMMAQEE